MKSTFVRALLAGLFVFMVLCCAGCGQKQEPVITFRLAINPLIYSGLIAVAEDRGYFRDAGLEVEWATLDSGHYCLERVASGEAQLATATDLAFVRKAIDNPNLKIAASIASVEDHELVARRDAGIEKPSDLIGKRVGVTFGTSGQYYLDTFLVVNGVEPSEVSRVDIRPKKLCEALDSGQVDAICSWNPIVSNAKQSLGDNAVSWPVQNYQPYHWVLAMREQDEQGPSAEAARRFLAALLKAQEFSFNRTDEAKSIIAGRWNIDRDYLESSWSRIRLSVTLDQSLVASLESAARWYLNQETENRPEAPPDVLEFITPGPLDSANPRAVTLYR